MNLPHDFINVLKIVYPNTWEVLLPYFKNKRPTTFRINTLKKNSKEFVKKDLKENKIEYVKGPIDNSYIVTKIGKVNLSYTDSFNKGYIYLQELSSMLPPIILDPKETDVILDMTAAPGSKTTQIANIVNNKAKILAVEKSRIRYMKLDHNVKLQSAKVRTLNDNVLALNKKFPEFNTYFDKILLDAPCSSEGRFILNNEKTYKYWSLRKIKEMQKQQKRLIKKAVDMLKPGGILVYSTCTINKSENEEVINWILRKNKKIRLEEITLNLPNSIKGNLKKNEELLKTVRILPNDIFTGFYIAKITKEK